MHTAFTIFSQPFTSEAKKINITISTIIINFPFSYFCERVLLLSNAFKQFKQKGIKLADILVLYCREHATPY